jgi:hypothetical protein
LASGIERNPMPEPKIAAMAWYEQPRGFVENFFSRAGRSDMGANSAVPFAVVTAKNSQDQRRVFAVISRLGWAESEDFRGVGGVAGCSFAALTAISATAVRSCTPAEKVSLTLAGLRKTAARRHVRVIGLAGLRERLDC